MTEAGGSAKGMEGDWKWMKPKYVQFHEMVENIFHNYSNIRIEFLDNSRQAARVKSKVINPLGSRDRDGKLYFYQAHGEYDDLFVKTENGWRIKERKWLDRWISGDVPPIPR